MYRRIRVYYKSLGILLILGLVDIILGNVTDLPSWGSEKVSKSPLISLEVNNLPLKEFFKEISNQTGYQILFDFDEQSENARITVKWDNQSLIQGMREITKKTGIKNFVIVTDNENRTLKVFNFGRGLSPQTVPLVNSDGTGLTLQELKAVHERQKQEIKMMKNNPDEIVIPPEGGHPGVTRRELQALHERQKKEIELSANDSDAIAIPASDGQPGLTNRQLQDLHERQKNTIKNMKNNLDEIVIPPEGGGHPGVTRRQLQALHERQKKEIELSANNPDAIAVPASDGHPALTKQELQDLHNQQKHKVKMMSNRSDEIVKLPEDGRPVDKKTSAASP
jgi:hypothetical protein